MKQADVWGNRSDYDKPEQQWIGHFPKLRFAYDSSHVSPAIQELVRNARLEKQFQEEKEKTYELSEERLLHAMGVIEKDGAERVMNNALIHQVSYSFDSVCAIVQDKDTCGKMTARVRTVTYADGRVEHFWTYKVSINGDAEREEYEGKSNSPIEALGTLKKKVQEFLDLDMPPLFDEDHISLVVVKRRTAMRYGPGRKSHLDCTQTEIDFDTLLEINGHSVPEKKIVDVEGKTLEQIEKCRHCLGLDKSPEFDFRLFMTANGYGR